MKKGLEVELVFDASKRHKESEIRGGGEREEKRLSSDIDSERRYRLKC